MINLNRAKSERKNIYTVYTHIYVYTHMNSKDAALRCASLGQHKKRKVIAPFPQNWRTASSHLRAFPTRRRALKPEQYYCKFGWSHIGANPILQSIAYNIIPNLQDVSHFISCLCYLCIYFSIFISSLSPLKTCLRS